MIEAFESIEATLTAPAAPVADVERALTELGRALDPEISVLSPQNAAVFERALALVVDLPVPAQGPALAQCLWSMAKYAYMSAQPLKGLAPAQLAVELFRRQGSRSMLHKALSMHGALLADVGNLPVAIETYADALETAVGLNDPFAEAAVCNNLGVALIYSAQYEEAIACLERVMALGQGNPELQVVRGAALTNIALARLHLEDYARGLGAAKDAVELLDHPTTTNERLSRALAETLYTRLLLEVDAPQAARERCELAKRFAHESRLERAELEAGMAEGLCEVYSGTVDVGLARLSRWLELARVLKGTLADALIAMVKANEVANRHDAALGYLRELMKHTRQVRQEHALLHHRLHIQQLRQRQAAPVADTEMLLEHRELTLLGKVASQAARREMVKAHVEMLERLAVTAGLRDDPTGLHPYRVGKLAALLAQELGWDEDTVFLLELAARLHDIGKIGIPEQLLLRRRRLTGPEIELAQSHALVGADILAQSNVPHLKMAEEIARFHHEHWDGSGYPFGLTYSAIPIAARITALADVFDELAHVRAYDVTRSVRDVLGEIASQRGRQFDPELTDLFVTLVPRLRREYGSLDVYLGQAARESPFIQARSKISSALKYERSD